MTAALSGASRAGVAADRSSVRSRLSLPALVLAALVVATFWSVVGHDFVIWDDNTNVTENPYVLAPSLEHVRRFWSRPLLGLYVPLSYTLFSAETWVSHAVGSRGPDPRVFHAVLLALHAATALAVLHLLQRFVARPWAALAGACVFALHPLQVEAVAWVSETRGVLSALFAIVALDLHLASGSIASTSPDANPARRARSLGLSVLATVSFALSLLAKPASATLPLAALCLDRWAVTPRRSWRWSLSRVAPWFVCAAIATWINKAEQSDSRLAFVTPIALRPFVATDALAFYLGKLAWPARLAADYGRTPARVIEHGGLYFSWIAPVACGLAILLVEDRRVLFASLCVFVACLLPVLGFVPFAYQDISTVADRYCYLALLGPAIAIAWGVDRTRRPAWKIGAVVLVGALAIASHARASAWASTRELFERTLAVQPKSVIAHHNLALAAALEGRTDEALEHYAAVLAIDPDHTTTLNNVGLIHLQRGELERAQREFEAALAAEPRYARAHVNLATVLFRMGRANEAEAHVREALEYAPDDPNAHNSLGNLLMARGLTRDAIAEYEASLAIRAVDPEVQRNLALALTALGDRERAIEHLRAALAIRPRWPPAERDLASALISRLGTSPADAREAVELAERALAASGGADLRTLEVLAASYSAVGRTDDALSTCDRAIAIARDKSPDRVADIEAKKRAYRTNAPQR